MKSSYLSRDVNWTMGIDIQPNRQVERGSAIDKQKFVIDDSHKYLMLQKMGRSWRQYKSRLTVALMKTKKKNYKGISYKQLRPSNLFTEAEWETYVKKRTSPEVENDIRKVTSKVTLKRHDMQVVHKGVRK
ncbi:hypothetical protein Sjap_005392 [Stephania japonica]|uniref:Uncharacterized protein n=1 Tax=Stephania japonica TaxID=461633 RepID=A0AAP0K5K5_9MAGN